jgi:hypothetical protein
MYDEEGLIYANGFEDAIIGIGTQFNITDLVCYNYDKCVEILMTRDGMKEEEAIEYMEYNVVGAYIGENTPIFIRELPK